MTKHTSSKPASKSQTLTLRATAGVTQDRVVAETAVSGLASNASAVVDFSAGRFGEVSLSDCLTVLQEKSKAVKNGDLSEVEGILTAQIASLNCIFTELARRAALNMGEFTEAFERYMRLALKAQSQCRTTAETLAVLTNPPVVYAKQANFAQGHQQINNAASAPTEGINRPIRAHARVRTRENKSVQNELLEDCNERMDLGASTAAITSDQELAAVGKIDRATNSGRKNEVGSKC